MNFRTIMLNVFSASIQMEKEKDKQRMNAPACNPTPLFQPLPFPLPVCVCWTLQHYFHVVPPSLFEWDGKGGGVMQS